MYILLFPPSLPHPLRIRVAKHVPLAKEFSLAFYIGYILFCCSVYTMYTHQRFNSVGIGSEAYWIDCSTEIPFVCFFGIKFRD